MIFDEFLAKKKIDRDQLHKAEPSLFREFELLYQEMGSKSFDHSKKFWFNKLRRLYPLVEHEKMASNTIEINQMAAQALPLISPSSESSRIPQSLPITESSEENGGAKAAGTTYKPRFKDPLKKDTENIDTTGIDVPEQPVKPSYVPRFKPGNTTIKVADPEIPLSENCSEQENNSKYKPRFRPGKTGPHKDD